MADEERSEFTADTDQFLTALKELESHLAALENKFTNAGPGITKHLQGIDTAAAKAASSLGVMGTAGGSSAGFFARATSGIQGFVGMLATLSHYTFLIPNSLGIVGTALGNLLGKVTPLGPKMVQAFSDSIPAMKHGLHQVAAFDAAVKALTGRLTPLSAALGYVSARLAGVSRQHAAAGAIGGLAFSTLVGGAGMFGNALRGLTGIAVSSMGTIGGAFATALPQFLPFVLAAGAIAAAFLAMKKAIHVSADFETTRVSFTSLIGNAELAKQSLQDLIAWSDKTPFNKFDITAAAKTLLAYGFAAKDLVGVLGDVGDTAAAMSKPIGDVANVLGEIRVGNFGVQQLRQLGITKRELEAQGLKFDANGSFQGTASDAMTAVRTVMREKFGGGMEDLAKTWQGMWSKFSTHVGVALRNVGEPLMASLKPGVDLLTQIVTDLGPSLAVMGAAIAKGIKVMIDGFRAQYDLWRPLILRFVDLFQRLANKFGFKPPAVEGGRDRNRPDLGDSEAPAKKNTSPQVGSLRAVGGGGSIGLGVLGLDPLVDEGSRHTRQFDRMIELLGGSQGVPNPDAAVPYLP